MRAAPGLPVLAVALLGCAAPSSASKVELPANARIVSGSLAAGLFNQCSRPAPKFAVSAYEPTAEDVATLENKLAGTLARTAPERLKYDPQKYGREYAAYDAGGHAMIYGNFFPLPEQGNWAFNPARPEIACDGGPAFFGVEYDVETHTIKSVAFNGFL